MNHNRTEITETLGSIIQAAFERVQFNDGIQIVDRLRDIEFDRFEDNGNAHYTATSFACDQGEHDEQLDSFKVSFHCEVGDDLTIKSAYAYDCRSGNQITTFTPDNERHERQVHA